MEENKHSQSGQENASKTVCIRSINDSSSSPLVADEAHSFSSAEMKEVGITSGLESGRSGQNEDAAQGETEGADELRGVTTIGDKIGKSTDDFSTPGINADDTDGDEATSAFGETPDDVTSDNETGDKTQEKRASLSKESRKGTGRDVLKFIEKGKMRTQTARRRGETLKKNAMELHTLTAAKVYLKAEYKGQLDTVYQFVYGADFALTPTEKGRAAFMNDANAEAVAGFSGESPVADALSRKNLKEIVSEAVSEGLDRTLLDYRSPSALTQDDRFNSPSTGARRPTSIRSRSASGLTCQICLKEEPFISAARGIHIPASWFVCSAGDCSARAHNECLGFPNVEQSVINAVAPWFCSVHVGCGRPPISNLAATSSTLSQVAQDDPADSSADEATARGRGRGARAGRPRSGRGSRGPRGGKGKASK